MSAFAEKLNIKNCVNSTEYCVHYIYTKCLDLQKNLNVLNRVNSTGNYVHYMYGISRFVETLNIQNCVNSTENCVHYICTKFLDLPKN